MDIFEVLISISILRKEMLLFFTLLGVLFLVLHAISDTYPTYHQEPIAENVSKKKHFLHAKKIVELCV